VLERLEPAGVEVGRPQIRITAGELFVHLRDLLLPVLVAVLAEVLLLDPIGLVGAQYRHDVEPHGKVAFRLGREFLPHVGPDQLLERVRIGDVPLPHHPEAALVLLPLLGIAG